MRSYAAEHIFAPLGMAHCTWSLAATPRALSATPYELGDSGAPHPIAPVTFPDWPSGMLTTSAAEFMRFIAAASNGGAAYGARILPAADMAAMLHPERPAGLPAWLTGQGLGWMMSRLDGRELVEHWGGDEGAFTAAYLDPRNRAGVLILTNLSASTASRDAIKVIAARLLRVAVP